jgi:hypothetical protein
LGRWEVVVEEVSIARLEMPMRGRYSTMGKPLCLKRVLLVRAMSKREILSL